METPATREQIMTALLALVANTGAFQTTGRRNRAPESITTAISPAAFLVEAGDGYERKSPSMPAIRSLLVKAFIYNDIGQSESLIPSTAINNAIEMLEPALQPDIDGRCTLGGLVYSCNLDGEGKRGAGEVTGKSLAVIPIKIILP